VDTILSELEEIDVSIQLVSPASGDGSCKSESNGRSHFVSIQLVSPASGDLEAKTLPPLEESVSIQLVSPASGDVLPG